MLCRWGGSDGGPLAPIWPRAPLEIYQTPMPIDDLHHDPITDHIMLSYTRHLTARGSAVRANAIRNFHPSARAAVKIGDRIPSVELQESSPGNKIDLSKELKGKGVIVGVPAAYCMASPLPMTLSF
jgi:hypothetical protein